MWDYRVKADRKEIEGVKVGDTLILHTSGRSKSYDTLVEVTKVTKAQFVVGTGADGSYRFWKTGPNKQNEVGGASSSWSSTNRDAYYPLDDDEIARVQAEMDERSAKAAESAEKYRIECEEKAVRKATRFEGKLETRRLELRQFIEDNEPSGDPANWGHGKKLAGQLMETVKLMARLIERVEWDLESNERSLAGYVSSEMRDLERVADHLERDLNVDYRVPDRIAEYVAERKALYAKGNELLHLSWAALGLEKPKDES
jgi:hypothetical protein